jgi:hypothetical protein
MVPEKPFPPYQPRTFLLCTVGKYDGAEEKSKEKGSYIILCLDQPFHRYRSSPFRVMLRQGFILLDKPALFLGS